MTGTPNVTSAGGTSSVAPGARQGTFWFCSASSATVTCWVANDPCNRSATVDRVSFGCVVVEPWPSGVVKLSCTPVASRPVTSELALPSAVTSRAGPAMLASVSPAATWCVPVPAASTTCRGIAMACPAASKPAAVALAVARSATVAPVTAAIEENVSPGCTR